jgi:hypothetical protein
MSMRHERLRSHRYRWRPPKASLKYAFELFEDSLHFPSRPNDVEIISKSPHSITRTAYLQGDSARHVLGDTLAHEVQVSLIENKNLNLGSTAVRIYGKLGNEDDTEFQIWNLYSLFREQMPRRVSYELDKSPPVIYPFQIVDMDGPELEPKKLLEFRQLRPDDLDIVLRAADMLANLLI